MSDHAAPEARAVGADQAHGIRSEHEVITPLEHQRGGELNAAVTSAIVGIHTNHFGRGPKTASTFHHGSVLVTLMHDVLTRAEKSLGQANHSDAIHRTRHLFQEAMEADFREAIERLTGRKVIAFISGNHIAPDIAAELFILDGPPGTP